MTLTLPTLTAILLAVFLCPTLTLVAVMKWWREDRADRKDERTDLMDRLFSRSWDQYKAVNIAENHESPQPATEAEEYEIWQERTGKLGGAGLDKVGTMSDN